MCTQFDVSTKGSDFRGENMGRLRQELVQGYSGEGETDQGAWSRDTEGTVIHFDSAGEEERAPLC